MLPKGKEALVPAVADGAPCPGELLELNARTMGMGFEGDPACAMKLIPRFLSIGLVISRKLGVRQQKRISEPLVAPQGAPCSATSGQSFSSGIPLTAYFSYMQPSLDASHPAHRHMPSDASMISVDVPSSAGQTPGQPTPRTALFRKSSSKLFLNYKYTPLKLWHILLSHSQSAFALLRCKMP